MTAAVRYLCLRAVFAELPRYRDFLLRLYSLHGPLFGNNGAELQTTSVDNHLCKKLVVVDLLLQAWVAMAISINAWCLEGLQQVVC